MVKMAVIVNDCSISISFAIQLINTFELEGESHKDFPPSNLAYTLVRPTLDTY